MISIITCSISPDRLSIFKKNIEQTIGTPFEIIAFDNRTHGFGLAKVYNTCAKEAIHPFLCFIHEDVKFNTLGWGNILIEKAQIENTGIIGFAGATAKLKSLSGWGSLPEFTRYSYIQHFRDRSIKKLVVNPDNLDYSPVILLDGFCLFVRKEIWDQSRFDENTFSGFHLYDLDFSLQVQQQYINYVCYIIEVEHFSEGAYSEDWLKDTILLHKKWSTKLPVYIDPTSDSVKRKNEIAMSRRFIKMLMKKKACSKEITKSFILNHIKQNPFHHSNICILFDYIKYQVIRK